jgi:hypothetical protein
MPMSKDKSNQDNRKYWKFVEETSQQVAKWPQWLRGTSPQQTAQQNPSLKKSAKKAKS